MLIQAITIADRQYEYRIDDKKSILPDNLIVNKPQRFMSDERIAKLLGPGLSGAPPRVQGVDYQADYPPGG